MRRSLLSISVAALAIALGGGVADAAPPANDDFAAATPLVAGADLSGSNVDATAQAAEPDPTGGSHSYTCVSPAGGPNCSTSTWYTLEPASSGEYTLETCDLGTELDTTLAVYTGAELATLALVKENGNGPVNACPGGNRGSNSASQLSFAAIGGTTYRVYVGGRDGAEGSFWLRAYSGPPQPRPAPDTGVAGESSAAYVLGAHRVGPGVRSGPRHTSSLAIETTPLETPVECSLDGGAYSSCGPAISHDGLAPGSSHVLQVRAKLGGVVDPTPVVHRFTIDTTPPQTTLIGPTGPILGPETGWTIASSERVNTPATAICGLDSMPGNTCLTTETFTALCQGPHSFSARAVDRASNPDPSPATAQIQVTTGPVCAAPTIESTGSTELPTELVFPATSDTKGAGGLLQVFYGKTSSYGTVENLSVEPSAAPAVLKITLQQLEPQTTYHYRLVLTTPFGTASTADQTATTDTPTKPLPTIQNGTPVLAGAHAAGLPVRIDTRSEATIYSLMLDEGKPVTDESGRVFVEDPIAKGLGTVTRVLPLMDLEPATTYHYRFAAEHIGTLDEVLGPEGTFTTPPFPVLISAPVKTRFRLRKGQVRVKPLTRKSRKLVARVRGLPTGSKVKLRLKVGKKKQTARKKARRNGVAAFRFSLSKRIRKELLDDGVKRYAVRVTAIPPEDRRSSVTIIKRIKGG